MLTFILLTVGALVMVALAAFGLAGLSDVRCVRVPARAPKPIDGGQPRL